MGIRLSFRSAAKITVAALYGQVPVTQAIVSGGAGQVVSAALTFDAITSLAIGSGPAVLVDVCYAPVSQNAVRGWSPIAEFLYPPTLPVMHPDYLCRPDPGERARPDAGSREAARSLQ